MNWNRITLQQFQGIHKLSKDKELDEMERISRAICIIYGKTEQQVDDMMLDEYNRLAKECAQFLQVDQLPGKAVKTVRVGTKKYAFNYQIQTLTHRQYVEIISFAQNPIDNMHLILASIVKRVRYGIRFKNKSEDHIKVANDMLEAPILPIFHSWLFFCQVYRNLMVDIQDYLIGQLMSKGMTNQEATKLITDSIAAMDGYTPQSKSQTSKGSNLIKSGSLV